MEKHVFQTPGLADQGVSPRALRAWNDHIKSVIESRGVSSFLVLDPRDIENAQISDAFRWPGNPREPMDCLGQDLAARLSDLGWASRAELHNEYLEYTLVMRPDHSGRMRPKRFVATTELAEWWKTMAVHDPEHVLRQIAAITQRTYSAEELLGMSLCDWADLDEASRADCFQRRLIGNGPSQPPEHPLNIDHALFLAKGSNTLADLITVMHCCSLPYSVVENGHERRARLDEILTFKNRCDLLCRHALSAAARDTCELAYVEGSNPPQGRALAFADPLGIYIHGFRTSDLFLGNENTPADWLRWSPRGGGAPMRLEFGPQDDDPRFLDEVTLGTGELARPISGYALAGMLEVGPLVTVAKEPRRITRVEFTQIPATGPEPIVCGLPETERCQHLSDFADQCDTRRDVWRAARSGDDE